MGCNCCLTCLTCLSLSGLGVLSLPFGVVAKLSNPALTALSTVGLLLLLSLLSSGDNFRSVCSCPLTSLKSTGLLSVSASTAVLKKSINFYKEIL